MSKSFILIILILTLQQTHNQLQCDGRCVTCSYQSPYDCTSCNFDSKLNLYVKSCQAIESPNLFLYIGVVLAIIHLLMILLGYGVYRNVFQNIQLLALLTWGYGSQSGANQLVVINFAIPKNNNFLSSFGAQFFLAIVIIGIFLVLVSAVDKQPHNSVATLIKRKKIIFPLRIETLIFNITVFCALSQVCTINSNTGKPDIAGIIVGILALLKQFALLVIIFYITNWSNFQIDDHNYYILIEKQSTCRWYARNNFFFSLLMRGLTLVFYVAFFDTPSVAGGLMMSTTIGYTLVTALGTKFIKLRFWIFNFISNLLTCGCVFCMYGCGTSAIGSDTWETYKKAYFILILILCAFFLLINMMQIIANSSQMCKQLRSIYSRFIICQKMDDAVQLNKYDSDRHREKVTSFRKNLVYQKEIIQKDDTEVGQINNSKPSNDVQ